MLQIRDAEDARAREEARREAEAKKQAKTRVLMSSLFDKVSQTHRSFDDLFREGWLVFLGWWLVVSRVCVYVCCCVSDSIFFIFHVYCMHLACRPIWAGGASR